MFDGTVQLTPPPTSTSTATSTYSSTPSRSPASAPRSRIPPSARTIGMELEGLWLVMNILTAGANTNFTDEKYNEELVEHMTGTGGVVDGNNATTLASTLTEAERNLLIGGQPLPRGAGAQSRWHSANRPRLAGSWRRPRPSRGSSGTVTLKIGSIEQGARPRLQRGRDMATDSKSKAVVIPPEHTPQAGSDSTKVMRGAGRRLACMSIVVMAAWSHGSESLSVCGTTGAAAEGGCWQPLEGKRNCHVWNPNPQPRESATFEGRSRCRGGKVSGTGTLTWRVVEDGETRVYTYTGPYSEGKESGQFVATGPGGRRAEGEYVGGKPHGHWVYSYPPGTEGKWDRIEGPWVDGVQQGKWTFVDYEKADGEFREKRREEGPIVNGQRQGDWVWIQVDRSVSWSLGDSVRTRVDREARVRYVNGRLHGPLVEKFSDGRRRTGEYAEGERVGRWVTLDSGEDIFEERNYVEGILHGKFVSTTRKGYETDHRVFGHFAHGLRDGLWVAQFDAGGSTEETYVAGMKHGAEVKTLANGLRRVGSFSNGQRTGQWSLGHESGDVLVEATYSDDEARDLSLPSASSPSATAPSAGRAPMDGAFGLLFGLDGFDQVKRLACDDGRSCLAAMADELLRTSPSEGEPNDSDYWSPDSDLRFYGFTSAFLRIRQPPRPVAGGRNYYVLISPKLGLVQIGTRIGEFSTEDSCEEEEWRLRELLRDKYGECTDYRFPAGSIGRSPIGQCDGRGLPERDITAFCREETEYVDGEERTKHHYVGLSYEILLEDDRTGVLNAWLKRGQVGAEDL